MTKTYEVQDWLGKVLGTFDTLQEADDFKLEICGDDEQAMEDIYIIGINEDGTEFPPEF